MPLSGGVGDSRGSCFGLILLQRRLFGAEYRYNAAEDVAWRDGLGQVRLGDAGVATILYGDEGGFLTKVRISVWRHGLGGVGIG